MSFKIIKSTFFIYLLTACAALGADRDLVNLGRWSNTGLAQIITTARQFDAPGDRIAAISRHFIDTPYAADTLIGDPQKKEQLVINLAGFDCFTFLDAVEALRRAADVADFPEQLKQVRYRDAKVGYENRRHFFSDWVADSDAVIDDVTAAVGQGKAQVVVKQLNLKSDGTHWLPGLPVILREISYIPTDSIDVDVLSALREGDYVGVYSTHAGLDVSHTGLIVKRNARTMLRHASSRDNVKRVVDEDLLVYLQDRPGLVVYRVK
jgi:hypothetical protein